MKAPWLQRISAGVSWFSEGQAGLVKHKIVRILRPGATINQHQLSRVHCTTLEKHIKYTLCPFPRLLQGQNSTACTSRYSQMSRNVSGSNKMRKEKQQQQRRHVFRAIFLWLRCHGYDATKVVLIKFGFSWTNICFYFTEQRRSFQSWWWSKSLLSFVF